MLKKTNPPPSTTPTARASRRQRERRKHGCVVMSVEVHLRALADLLIEKRFLREWDDNSREAIHTAFQEYLRVLIRYG